MVLLALSTSLSMLSFISLVLLAVRCDLVYCASEDELIRCKISLRSFFLTISLSSHPFNLIALLFFRN